MPWSAAASIGGALISGSMASDAAGDAADAQSQACAKSIAEQRRQYDLTRADNAPFRNTGVAANSKLATLLGIGGAGAPGTSNIGSASLVDLSSGKPSYNSELYNSNANYRKAWDNVLAIHATQPYGAGGYQSTSQPEWIEYQLRNQVAGMPDTAASDDYGSLLKKFSAEDLQADPVYQSGLQFGLDQGTGAINSRALAGGNYDSGATLKALTRYANDYGSTKANESYNRYNTTNDSIYNKLAGVSGAGQQATQQVSAAGQNMANNISGILGSEGANRAAGIVGGANAWGDAIGGIGSNANNYNKYLKGLTTGTTPQYSWDGTDWSSSGYGVDGGYSDY